MKKKLLSVVLAVLILNAMMSFMFTITSGAVNSISGTYPREYDLQSAIKSLDPGGTIDVNGGAIWFEDYVNINKPCTINFHGVDLASNRDTNTMLYLTAENIVLNFYDCYIFHKDMFDHNGYYICGEPGSAIYINNDLCTINGHDSTLFYDCNTSYEYGAAIYINDGCTDCKIIGCTFENCHCFCGPSYPRDCAIYIASDNCEVDGCHFILNFPDDYGYTGYPPCVYSEEGNTVIKNCDPDIGTLYGGNFTIENYHRYSNCIVEDSCNRNYVDIEEGDYRIVPVLDEGKCLNINPGDAETDLGANLEIRSIGNAKASSFNISRDNTGAYIIKSNSYNRVLDVAGCSTDNGANICQWDSNGSYGQRWRFIKQDDGSYIISTLAGKCIDVDGCSTADGANVHSYAIHGDTNQRFKLVKLDNKGKPTNTGSTLSEGNLTLIIAIAAAVVFGLGGFFAGSVFTKKKVLATADGTPIANNEDDE